MRNLIKRPVLRPYPDDYSYQSTFMKNVPASGIILDISSGHNPFPRATILSDRYLEMTTHRHEPITIDDRPFVLLDVHHLPFKTKSIDYVYCSHVLEHVDDPIQACAEIMRIAKAGYIETPTLMKDALFSWARDSTHKWYVVQHRNRLVFFEYDDRRQQGVRSTLWRDAILSERYHPLQDLFYPNQDLFNSYLEWTSEFQVTVFYLDRDQPVTLEGAAQACE